MFKKIKIYGNKKNIDIANTILSIRLPNLDILLEDEARLQLQYIIDSDKIEAHILYNGNTVWSKNKILKNLRQIIRHNDMDYLSDYFYQFLSLSCGSIAHYNKQGWIEIYPTFSHLKKFFQENEFGVKVINHIPRWKTDVFVIVQEIEKELKIK